MPLIAPPQPWTAPVMPVHVARAYRAAPRFVAGGRRTVRLVARAGESVRAPCSGRVSFAGHVAGGPAALTIDCGGWRATLSGVATGLRAGGWALAGVPIGTAPGTLVGLSARAPDGAYRDPVPLLSAARPRHPAPPVALRARAPRQTSAQPRPVRGLSTVGSARGRQSPADIRMGASVDVPLGVLGAGVGGAGLLALLWRARWAPRRGAESVRRPGRAHRVALRR